MEPKRSQDRPKINYACESCRAAKVKCQPGIQPGICKLCDQFKRECIFRTGPRTRRPKSTFRAGAGSTVIPPPPGPSKTFSIDFEMPVVEDPVDEFEALRQQHERYLDDLALDGDEDNEQQQVSGEWATNPLSYSAEQRIFNFADMSSSSPSASGTSSSQAGSSTGPQRSKPLVSLGIKPQFNLDSATKLLAYFRDMLPHMPCLVLPEDADVRSLAKSSPFLLLAILAVASCSTSLQGHSLYDEEFRKVFGLKFVAGGERSLELLQGLLIYCAWYPLHLRPKNRQAFQYLRMAVDIVHDLELDQEPDADVLSTGSHGNTPNLDNFRALLGCFFATSAYTSVWVKPLSLRFTAQLARSAEILERYSELEQDHYLVWLVRQQYIFGELIENQRAFMRGPRDHQSEMQRDLIRAGLEAQFQDFKATMPQKYASMTSTRLGSLVTEAVVLAPALINVSRRHNSSKAYSETIPPDRLLRVAHKVRAFFDHVTSLTPREIRGFSGADYGRFVVSVIMAYRLSFPMASVCREYDVAQGRQILDLGTTLRRLVDDRPPENSTDRDAVASASKQGKTDVWSAFRVVLRSVMNKYEEKRAAFEPSSTTPEDWTIQYSSTCPMLNGSMDQYIPLWADQQPHPGADPHAAAGDFTGFPADAGLGADMFAGPMAEMGLGAGMGEAQYGENPQIIYHDLWATMTMGWAGDGGMGNVEPAGY
ncbi:hypothetical protein F4861DRAFT_492298 [Xylaria intraflava]|nr:hypothetical protein F4861DRAFT_492298 [Xylaria intraflava]